MRRLALSLGLIVGLAAPAAAFAGSATPAGPAPAPPATPGKDDPNRIVCTGEHVVDSNRPRKVCMTVAQREELRDQAMREMDEGRRGLAAKGVMNGGNGGGGGGPY